MNYRESILNLRHSGASAADIVGHVFSTHEVDIAGVPPDLALYGRTEIARKFGISVDSVYVYDAGKYGFGLDHGYSFQLGLSELRFAVTDSNFFEHCFLNIKETFFDSLDSSAFPGLLTPGARTPFQVRQKFIENSRRGILDFKFMPSCDIRNNAFDVANAIVSENSSKIPALSLNVYRSIGTFFEVMRLQFESYFCNIEDSNTISKFPAAFRVHPVPVRKISLDAARPPSMPSRVWELLSNAFKEIHLTWILIVPLGTIDQMSDCYDLLIGFNESSNPDEDYAIFKLASAAINFSIAARFVATNECNFDSVNAICSHLLTIGKEHGEAALAKRQFIEIARNTPD